MGKGRDTTWSIMVEKFRKNFLTILLFKTSKERERDNDSVKNFNDLDRR